jgi:predicted kinase
MSSVKLHFLCGKMAAGKSTLARELAKRENALLLVEDELLTKLFPEEIRHISDYVKYSTRLKDALSDHIVSVLASGTSVVLDFPGNTTKQRSWFRRLFERAQVAHELHFIDASDELCKRQLKERSKDFPDGTAFTTDSEFEAITRYFQAPSPEEGFNVTVCVRAHP